MKNIAIWVLLLSAVVFWVVGCGEGHNKLPRLPGRRLAYAQDFSDPNGVADFEYSDIATWWLMEDDGKGFLLQSVGESSYTPPVRSPKVIAVLRDRVFGDFTLEADIMQTGKEYGHRDMCIFFGIRNATHYYYAHIASAADKVSHTIHIVNGTDRTPIATYRSDGVEWGSQQWHHIKLVRKMNGLIELYFDYSKKPIMTANDITLAAGYIGFGSFDDQGKIDNIKIYAKEMLKKKSRVFE